MAISTDNRHVNIEFVYEKDGESIWVKYHNTDMGPTISISDDGKEWFNLPASLFSETTDFLRNEHGVLGGTPKPSTKQPNKPFSGRKPQLARAPSLQPPVIVSPEGEEEEDIPQPIEVANIRPVQSLTALANDGSSQLIDIPASQPKAGIVIHTDQQNESVSDQQDESVSNDTSGRPVIRHNREADNKMSEEAFIQRNRQNEAQRGFNEAKGMVRLD